VDRHGNRTEISQHLSFSNLWLPLSIWSWVSYAHCSFIHISQWAFVGTSAFNFKIQLCDQGCLLSLMPQMSTNPNAIFCLCSSAHNDLLMVSIRFFPLSQSTSAN
jgi:hypothetical protein